MNSFRKINSRLALSLATALVAFAPVMVSADAMTNNQTVRFSTESVHTASGARELYAHIKQAAYTVCGMTDVESNRIKRPSVCVDDAIARAVRDVQSPQLAQRYVQLNGAEAATKNGIETAIRTAQR